MIKLLSSIVASIALGTTSVVGYNYVAGLDQIRAATWHLTGEQGSCSSVAIEKDVLLTAAHCDQPGLKVNGKNAIVVKKDEKKDLMLLYVPTLNSPTVSIGDQPERNDEVVAAGVPLGMEEFITEGRVQGFIANYIYMSAPIIFGNSGGGLFAFQGGKYKLVGINSAVAVAGAFFPIPVPHMGVSASTDSIKEFLE